VGLRKIIAGLESKVIKYASLIKSFESNFNSFKDSIDSTISQDAAHKILSNYNKSFLGNTFESSNLKSDISSNQSTYSRASGANQAKAVPLKSGYTTAKIASQPIKKVKKKTKPAGK
jgi:hypothetical protein